MKFIPMLALLVLSGCVTDNAVFDPRGCPREKTYTAEQQTQIANDLKKTPRSVKSAMIDYGKLRDKARACRGEKTG